MALHQLGQVEQARKQYDEMMKQWDEEDPASLSIYQRRYQAEVEELLEVAE